MFKNDGDLGSRQLKEPDQVWATPIGRPAEGAGGGSWRVASSTAASSLGWGAGARLAIGRAMNEFDGTGWFGRLLGGLIALAAVAAASPAYGLQFDFREVRSWQVPQGFALGNSVVRSGPDGSTLVAATAGEGAESSCTVVVASKDSARAYPYRHSERGSSCVGALPHPDGGFFVRGFRADAEEGDVAGFTARLDAEGRERWLVPDTELSEQSEFRGTYRRPHWAMAYSLERDRLLTFTVGRLKLGMLDERDLTQASVIGGGELSVPARTIGGTGGAGTVGGAEILQESGDFLVFVYRPTMEGGAFYTFDGRQQVDAFEPLGEDWSERFVRRMIVGPDGDIYILWTEDREEGSETRMAVVDEAAEEIWSERYDASATVDGETVELGSPRSFWVGSSNVLVLYPSDPTFVRVLDAETGEQRGIAQLSGSTALQPLSFVRGPEGELRFLGVDAEQGRFRELRVDFREGGSAGDAGLPDGGLVDAGGSGGSGGNGSGGNGGGGGGCSTNGSPPDAPLRAIVVWVLLVAPIAVSRGRERDPEP